VLARVLGPLVRGRHLQLHSINEAEQAFFELVDADGAIPALRGDGLTVVTQNASRTKIDWYLRRTIDYEVDVDPDTGAVDATVTVQLSNEAPSSGVGAQVIGPPEVGDLTAGQSLLDVSIYTPLDLAGATVDGEDVLVTSFDELGRRAYSTFVRIEPQSTAIVVLRLTGTVALPGGDYRLDLGHQPTGPPDEVRVVVNGRERTLQQDERATVRFGLG
jgi:hypothetical protein